MAKDFPMLALKLALQARAKEAPVADSIQPVVDKLSQIAQFLERQGAHLETISRAPRQSAAP